MQVSSIRAFRVSKAFFKLPIHLKLLEGSKHDSDSDSILRGCGSVSPSWLAAMGWNAVGSALNSRKTRAISKSLAC